MGQGGVACPKPEPLKRTKHRKLYREGKVKKSVRAGCVDRDGVCRFGDWELNPNDTHSDALEGEVCEGRSEWAHIGDKKRFKTRGQSPEQRHTAWGSLMLCTKHHHRYDRAQMRIKILTPFGANGPLGFER